MPPTEDTNAWILIVGGLAQAAYYTALLIAVGARISSRLAVMEFQVNELWRGKTDAAEEG